MRRVLPATLLLLIWGSAQWPTQIDDQYISLAYARQFSENGLLLWSNHERVEGYSNFLYVILQTLMLSAGIDPDLGCKFLGILCAIGVIAAAAWRAPRGAGIALLGLASWIPLGWWAFAGMETTLYSFLLSLGWGLCLRKEAGGHGLLWLAAMTRPEGIAHLLVSLFYRWDKAFFDTSHQRYIGFLAMALGMYHGLRYAWFGAWLPTPYLVKVAENPWEVDVVIQLAQELISLAGLAAVLRLSVGRPKAIVFVPLAIQCFTMLISDADWMGHGRLMLPGAAASVLLWMWTGSTQRPSWGRRGLAIGMLAFSAQLDPPGIGREYLGFRSLDPVMHIPTLLQQPLDSPAAEDLAWVVRNAPEGSLLLTGDVGMVGHLPGIEVLDLNGLTSRRLALANLGALELRQLRADRPRLLRLLDNEEPEPWMGGGFRQTTAWKLESYRVRWWAAAAPEPDPSLVRARWEALIEAFPSQGALRRGLIEDLASSGDTSEALETLYHHIQRWPQDRRTRSLRQSISFPERRAGAWVSASFPPAPLRLGYKAGRRLSLRYAWICPPDSGPGTWERLDVEGKGTKNLECPCDGGRLSLSVPGSSQSAVEAWLEPAQGDP